MEKLEELELPQIQLSLIIVSVGPGRWHANLYQKAN